MLIIDVGNTSMRLILKTAEDFRQLAMMPTRATSDTIRIFAAAAADHRTEAGVITSVVPQVDRLLQKVFPGFIRISGETDFPFRVSITERDAVGADRYCNMAAALARGWSTALVVDVGTATTFDLLLDGNFVGGLIAPGPVTAAEALIRQGARLPETIFTPDADLIGRDTVGALQAGCWWTASQGIKGTIEAITAKHGAMPVMLTGGLGETLHGWLRREDPQGDYHTDIHWTARGAAYLADSIANT